MEFDVSQIKSCEDAEWAFPGFEHNQEIVSDIFAAIDDCESITVSEDGMFIVRTKEYIETIVEPSGM